MNAVDALVTGFARFKQEIEKDPERKYQSLVEKGQHPKILMIACSDSRVDPAIITNSGVGELLVVRNIANLVPAYEEAGASQCTVNAALELSLEHLEVEHVIVMGHSRCGGIASLVNRVRDGREVKTGLDMWTAMVEQAAIDAINTFTRESEESQYCYCSRQALSISLANLLGYPNVREAVNNGRLSLHGWYLSIADGELEEINQQTGEFFSLLSEGEGPTS